MAYPDEWSVDIAINTSGIDILGTPIGTPDYVSACCMDKAKSGTELCSKLLELDDPQSSLLLLRHCHVPSLNHLSRTVIPEQLNKAALIHDDQTYRTFSSVMSLDVLDPDSWFQTCLPIRHGGCSLSKMQPVAPMALLAAWAHTSRELSLRLNSHELIDNLFERQSFEGSLSHHLSLAWATIQEQMPEKSLVSEKSLRQILEDLEKLQYRFTCTMADHDYNLLVGKENSHEVSARLRSVSERELVPSYKQSQRQTSLHKNPANFA